MSERIFFHLQQAGGANALLPLIRQWSGRFEFMFSGPPPMERHLAGLGLACRGPAGGGNPGDLAAWLAQVKPGLVITDTINLSRSPTAWQIREVWLAAAQLSTPALAYVDSWWAYGRRFRLPGEDWPEYLPASLAVVDELAAAQMAGAGLPPERTRILGSPRFAHLLGQRGEKGPRGREAARARLGLADDQVLLTYVSQPLREHLCSREPGWGLDESQTLAALLECLAGLPGPSRRRVSLLVLLHPEDDEAALRQAVEEAQTQVPVRFAREDWDLSLLRGSDLVAGVFSILLTEAVVLGLPVLSVQIGMTNQDMLVTNLAGATRPVRRQEDLAAELTALLFDRERRAAALARQEGFAVVADAPARWERETRRLTRKEAEK